MKRIALTFDDGPSRWTPPILSLLGTHRAKATFFALGSHVIEQPFVTQRILREGHELGVHGWDHKPVEELSADEIADQLADTCEQISRNGDTVIRWWRPPWHRMTLAATEAAERLGLSYCAVTLDGRDVSREADAIADTVRNQISDGSIIGLHDGIANNGEQHVTHRENTVRAVEQILVALKYQYRFVTVSELLG